MTFPLLLTYDELVDILTALELAKRLHTGDYGTNAGVLYDKILKEFARVTP